jgi:hypothetical protein
LEKKRILKEDGRYLLFYHSASTATGAQSAAFADVAAEAETVTAPTAEAMQSRAAGQERTDV